MESKATIDCDWFEDRIEDFLDGDLSSEHNERFQNHRQTCASCREEIELAERVLLSVRAMPEIVCPDKVIGAVLERTSSVSPLEGATSSESEGWSRWRTWFGWTPLALPALALLVALIVNPTQEGTESPVVVEAPPVIETPQYTEAEIAEAEHQVKVTMAFIGKVGMKGIKLAGREAIEEGILLPAEKTVVAMLESDALKWGKRAQQEANP